MERLGFFGASSGFCCVIVWALITAAMTISTRKSMKAELRRIVDGMQHSFIIVTANES